MKTDAKKEAPQSSENSNSKGHINPLQLLARKTAGIPVANPLQRLGNTVAQQKRVPSNAELATYNSKRGDDGSASDISEVVANYNKSLETGKKLIGKGIKWYTKSRDAEPPVTDDATEKKVSAAGYKDFWFPSSNGITVCTHRGSSVARIRPGRVAGYKIGGDFEDDQSFMYSNSFDVITGQFNASINYRNVDDHIAAEEGLPPSINNSEIIWHQHLVAKAAAAELGGTREHMSSIKSIERKQVNNTPTRDTIYVCDNGIASLNETWTTLDEPTEDAIALLGSPNGNSALWLLMQHGHESSATDIESVSYTMGGLKINYM